MCVFQCKTGRLGNGKRQGQIAIITDCLSGCRLSVHISDSITIS